MNTNKATHDGHCQLCGRLQRLPKGMLAKHGYTKEWGFFSGTCPGSDHLPFEQSRDLIAGALERVAHSIKGLQDSATYLRTEPVKDAMARAEVYVRTAYGRQWLTGEVKLTEKQIGQNDDGPIIIRNFVLATVSGEYKLEGYSHGYPETVEAMVKALREKEAKHHDRQAAELEKYRVWLVARNKDWKPAPLIPRGAK